MVGPAARDRELLVRMRDQMVHRGPDHGGIWQSADSCAALAHRRLAIIDLDARSNQPFVSNDGRFIITYNGEIYNFRALRRQLEMRGVRFQSESDTEVIIEAFRYWRETALDYLSGMFAFAIWDQQTRELFCARDRAGEKPFHYAIVAGNFAFASELKALAAWPQMPRNIDVDAVTDFLVLGFVADPKSIWASIRKLPAAHYLKIQQDADGKVSRIGKPVRYWSLQFGAAQKSPDGERIRSVLQEAAQEMSVSDVPYGAFLSGGVDSSAVTAALSLSGHRVRTYTIGFAEQAYDERPWARMVADRYDTEHSDSIVNASDIGAVFDRLGWHFDEPFGDYSSIPTYYLSRNAVKGIKVALSGDGADELFCGYRKYQRLANRTQLLGPGRGFGMRLVSRAADRWLRGGSRRTRVAFQYMASPVEAVTDMITIGAPRNLLSRLARGALASAICHYHPIDAVRTTLNDAMPPDAGILDVMRHVDFVMLLPGDMLTKVDRASMAVSLEVRPLFLHRAVMELAAQFASRDLADARSSKIALRNSVRAWLPDSLLNRTKQGFAMPLPAWIGGSGAASWRMPALKYDAPLAQFVDLDVLEGLRGRHLQGAGDFTQIL
jgi:asparagine synthase (glutamine-hydrolysing)